MYVGGQQPHHLEGVVERTAGVRGDQHARIVTQHGVRAYSFTTDAEHGVVGHDTSIRATRDGPELAGYSVDVAKLYWISPFRILACIPNKWDSPVLRHGEPGGAVPHRQRG